MSDEKDEKEVVEETVKEASAADFFAVRNQVPVERVELKGIGVVYIHGFTGVQKADWQKACQDEKGEVVSRKVEPLMMVLCVKDKAGKPLFKEEDIQKLMELPAAVLGEVTDVCMRLSGMGEDADRAILRNFEATQTEDS